MRIPSDGRVAHRVALFAAACGGRGDDNSSVDSTTSTTAGSGTDGSTPSGAGPGDFGTLTGVCGPNEGGGAVAVGRSSGRHPGHQRGQDRRGHSGRSRLRRPARAQPGDLRRRQGLRRVVQRGRGHQRQAARAEPARRRASRSTSRWSSRPARPTSPSWAPARCRTTCGPSVGAACGLIDIAGFSVTPAEGRRRRPGPHRARGASRPSPTPATASRRVRSSSSTPSSPVPRPRRRSSTATSRRSRSPSRRPRPPTRRWATPPCRPAPTGSCGESNWQPFAVKLRDAGVESFDVHRRGREPRQPPAGDGGDRLPPDGPADGDQLLRPASTSTPPATRPTAPSSARRSGPSRRPTRTRRPRSTSTSSRRRRARSPSSACSR